MRGVLLPLLALMFLPLASAADSTATLQVEPSIDAATIHRGEGITVMVHITGSMECTLPGAPEDAVVRLSTSVAIADREERPDVVWSATPAGRTLPWRETSLMRFAIDETFQLRIESHRPDGAAGPARTDVLRWLPVQPTSDGVECDRSYAWTLQSGTFELTVLPPLSGEVVPGEPTTAEPARAAEFQGVSHVPIEGKIAAGGALAAVLGTMALFVFSVRRVR